MSGITRRHGYNFQHVEVGNLLLEAHGCQWRIHLVRASFEDREAGWYVQGLGIADPASKAGDYCATMDEAIRHAAELADQVKAQHDAAIGDVSPGMAAALAGDVRLPPPGADDVSDVTRAGINWRRVANTRPHAGTFGQWPTTRGGVQALADHHLEEFADECDARPREPDECLACFAAAVYHERQAARQTLWQAADTPASADAMAEKAAALSPGAAAMLTNMVAEAIEVDAAAIELQALLGDQLALHAGMTEARHRYATSGMTLAACIRSVARDVKAGDWPTR